MPEISVIVPVYNVAAYLPTCIESLISQSMTDIGIILVDDGSTDGCGGICDRYASLDDRISVIHKQNEGLSIARNDGLDAAQAEYVMFVDGDDWVETEFCELPSRTPVKYDSDIVVFMHNGITRCGRKKKRILPVRPGMVEKNMVITDSAVWNKLYKRQLFQDIRFPENMVFEDVGTVYKLIHAAEKVYVLDEWLYNYRILRRGSINDISSKRYVKDRYTMFVRRIRDLKKWGYDITPEVILLSWYILVYRGRTDRIGKRASAVIRSLDRPPESFCFKRKAAYYLFKFSPSLFDYVCIITGRRRKI